LVEVAPDVSDHHPARDLTDSVLALLLAYDDIARRFVVLQQPAVLDLAVELAQ
jgi:hypothetical protein